MPKLHLYTQNKHNIYIETIANDNIDAKGGAVQISLQENIATN